MDRFLFMAHSGLRYLVLAAGALALVVYLLGLVQKRPWSRSSRAFGAAYLGLLDLQILLGVILVFVRPWYPAMIGHLAMMALAAGAGHGMMVANRKRSQPTFGLALAAVAVSLALVIGGVFAIRPSLF